MALNHNDFSLGCFISDDSRFRGVTFRLQRHIRTSDTTLERISVMLKRLVSST